MLNIKQIVFRAAFTSNLTLHDWPFQDSLIVSYINLHWQIAGKKTKEMCRNVSQLADEEEDPEILSHGLK